MSDTPIEREQRKWNQDDETARMVHRLVAEIRYRVTR